jgi:hypothetical protein
MVYEMCSTNKFYSKIFADLFAELASKYNWLMDIFLEKYEKIMEQFNDIQYFDADKDYDKYCEMNKKNEKRRSITTFYLNLAKNGFVKKLEVVKILRDIIVVIVNLINLNDKKNEVDELTEIVGILFNKDLIEEVINDADDETIFNVNNTTIIETVCNLAKLKAKDYPSLSNKAIFKYMDLVEM